MAELHVSKKSIGKLFSEMQSKKFIIPDYQRPYAWDIEKCETLWNDITSFAQTYTISDDTDYFLGTIVSYINDDKNQEIIDGQQRVTSILLLLRAFYTKLESMPENDDVKGLKNQIAPCIWDIDKISQAILNKTQIRISSLVATTEDNDKFHHILQTGAIQENAQDNYSKNYLFFTDKCNEYATNDPMQWKNLCITILQKCILLPIECDTQDTALTIFSTLNDRGMPLADSDIFKAQLYRNCANDTEKKQFTETWKNLTYICKQGNLSIDDIFRYYTHILRARNNDRSKEVGLRKFYAQDKYAQLQNPKIIHEIMDLAYFWRLINADIEPENDYNYSISTKAKTHLHCLSSYPNDFWKYPTSVFFLSHKDSSTFEKDFEQMLEKLIAFLFVKFIDHPSVNAIKDDIYNACITFNKHTNHQYKSPLNDNTLQQRISELSSSRISKSLLLLYAYLHPAQQDLISKFDIEHIFPKKWQNTNYNGWSESDAELYLDRFGNKVVFEKKLNIQAGNGYFGRKKQAYAKSKIALVQDLVNHPQDDWGKQDIETRDDHFKTIIMDFFKKNLTA